MPGTIKNHMLMDRYSELVRTLYAEPKDEIILGSFLRPLDVPCASTNNEGRKKVKCPISKKKQQKPNRDIRTSFYKMHEDLIIIQKTDENPKIKMKPL